MLYGCTTWTLTKRMEKKLDDNYTRMLRAILNKSWKQHPTKQQLYGHLPPITKTIKIRWTRHTGHCWKSRDSLISDILLWTTSHGRAKEGRPAKTYIQQLCADTGCNSENLPKATDDREGWREMVKDTHALSTTWWWWGWWLYWPRNSSSLDHCTLLFSRTHLGLLLLSWGCLIESRWGHRSSAGCFHWLKLVLTQALIDSTSAYIILLRSLLPRLLPLIYIRFVLIST